MIFTTSSNPPEFEGNFIDQVGGVTKPISAWH